MKEQKHNGHADKASISSRYATAGIFLAIGIALYWQWAFPYRAALGYREERQLFLTTGEYFRETVTGPWEFVRYIGEFLTQFFNNVWAGAAVMAGLILLFLFLCYLILRRIAPGAPRIAMFAIALIPSLAVWLLYGDPNLDLSLITGLCIGAGILLLIVEIIVKIKRIKSPENAPKSSKAWKIIIPALACLEIVACVILYPKAYNPSTYRLIDYDYLVRTNDWDGILRLSDRQEPDLPLSVSATNLAMGMTGQLDSGAFRYYQNGTEGLFPPFMKETLSSWTTGEIFYQLGMVNSAQRFYFEGMEAIPTYAKSGRALKRLAETAIIRGEYPVAEKYLRILENTLFYRKWAERNLELIINPEAVASHPEYGKLRNRMIDEDYMFSEGELDKTLGQLFIKDPTNDLARQYLILYPLLQRDLGKFTQYMGVVAEYRPTYNPLLAQQTMAFMSMKSGQPAPPGMVPDAVTESLRNFARAWTSKDPVMMQNYNRTLYHYLVSEE